MKFTFLGTGTSQGVPIIGCSCEVCSSDDCRDKRLRTAGMIQSDSTTVVFDTGPDFRQQMLRENVSQLDAVVFTHQHKDHVAGLDDVRAFNYLQKKDMPVFANAETIQRLKVEFGYAFDNTYPGVPKLAITEIHNQPFSIGDILFHPIPVMHKDMEVLGFRVGDFSYITDANYISNESLTLLKGTRILVLNALRRTPHYSHFTLEEAIQMVDNIGPAKAYFIHISHLLGTHKAVNEEVPDGIELAWDGLTIDIG